MPITPAQAVADEYQPVRNFTGNRWKDIGMADRFMIAWNQQGIHHSDLTAEYQFDADRKWKFDFAFPSCRVALEFDGSGFGHMAHAGRREDMEKRNEAVRQGWRILVYESSMLALSRMHLIVSDVIDVLAPPQPVDVADLLPIGAI